MTETGYHNLEPLKLALEQLGFSSMQELYKFMRERQQSDRMSMLEQEKDEHKRMLLTNAIRYLGMESDGSGK